MSADADNPSDLEVQRRANVQRVLRHVRARARRKLQLTGGADDFGEGLRRPRAGISLDGGRSADPVVTGPGVGWSIGPPPVSVGGDDPVLRARVLQVATSFFERHDFRRVSLEDVARAAGINRVKLTELYATKEELFYEVLGEEMAAFERGGLEFFTAGRPISDLLRSLSEFSFAYLHRHPLLLQLTLGMLSESSPKLAARCQELRERSRALMVRALELGREQGALRADLDAEMTAQLLIDLHLAGFLIAPPHGEDVEAYRKRRRQGSQDLILRGILAPR